MIATLLRELAAAGIERAFVVTGHLAEQVEALLEDGGFGLELSFVRQPSPDGSADTVRRALAAGAEPPLVVTAADTVYGPGDIARFLDGARGDGALAVRREPPPGPGRPPAEIEDGRVVRVVGREGELSGAPLWLLTGAAARAPRRPARPAVRARGARAARHRHGPRDCLGGDREDPGFDGSD